MSTGDNLKLPQKQKKKKRRKRLSLVRQTNRFETRTLA